MKNPFEFGSGRYSPADGYPENNVREYQISQIFFASLVGVIALGLPAVLVVAALIRGCFYNSISHNYYVNFLGDIFVSALAMIAVFLFAYRGQHPKENTVAAYAGFCALGVALFPTKGPGVSSLTCSGRAFFQVNNGAVDTLSFRLFHGAEVIHYLSAGLFFAFLGFYALVIFTRPNLGRGVTAEKLRRNKFYRTCGVLIFACLGLLILNFVIHYLGYDLAWWDRFNITFWLEAIALGAFGVSWIVKGRAFGLATALIDTNDELVKNRTPADMTVGSLIKQVSFFLGFLASCFAVYQGFVHFFPPSQSLPGIKHLAIFEEEGIANGGNRDFARLIRSNVDRTVFIKLTVNGDYSGEVQPINQICGEQSPTFQSARFKPDGDLVIWHIEDEWSKFSDLETFCSAFINGDVFLDNLIVEFEEDAQGRSCGRITTSSGGIQMVSHHVNGFFRVERGFDSNVEHYVLKADIPVGQIYEDTITKYGGC